MKNLEDSKNPFLTKWVLERGEPHKFIGNRLVDKRVELAEEYAWAIPNESALEEIARHEPIIEIGAGIGYWSRLLQEMNCEILPMDTFPPGQGSGWTNIYYGSFSQLERFTGHTLFCCWIPQDIVREEVLKYKPKKFLWVGEPIKINGYAPTKEIEIPQWNGFEDKLFVIKR